MSVCIVQRRLHPPYAVQCLGCNVQVLPSPVNDVVLRWEYVRAAHAPRDDIDFVDGRWTVVRKSDSHCCSLVLHVPEHVRAVAIDGAARCEISEDVPLEVLTFTGTALICGLVTSLTANAFLVQADTVSRVNVIVFDSFYLRRGDQLMGRVRASNGAFKMIGGTVDVLDVKAGSAVVVTYIGAPGSLRCSCTDGDVTVVGGVREFQTVAVRAEKEQCAVPTCIYRVEDDAHVTLCAPQGLVRCKLALV